jgi:uncharacterized membrane protein
MMEIDEQNRRHVTIKDLIFMLAIGFGVGFLTLKVGPMLPPVGEVLNAFGWTVVLATIVGVLLSLTRLSELEFAGASNVGSVLFYMLLATIGAKADIAGILDAPLFALAGVMIIATHASMILLGGHLLKVPMFLMATSSPADRSPHRSLRGFISIRLRRWDCFLQFLAMCLGFSEACLLHSCVTGSSAKTIIPSIQRGVS